MRKRVTAKYFMFVLLWCSSCLGPDVVRLHFQVARGWFYLHENAVMQSFSAGLGVGVIGSRNVREDKQVGQNCKSESSACNGHTV